MSNNLVRYAHHFFRDVEVNRLQLLRLAAMVVDRIYRFAAEVIVKDVNVKLYFGQVSKDVLDLLAYRGVRVFYILDDEIRFDRFEVTLELLICAGVSIVGETTYFVYDETLPAIRK